jgi:ParE toxin of type II toxin-antitoxin system, parDE
VGVACSCQSWRSAFADPALGELVLAHDALGVDPQQHGTYRIVYRIDENSRIVHVLDIDHRSAIYHRPQQ